MRRTCRLESFLALLGGTRWFRIMNYGNAGNFNYCRKFSRVIRNWTPPITPLHWIKVIRNVPGTNPLSSYSDSVGPGIANPKNTTTKKHKKEIHDSEKITMKLMQTDRVTVQQLKAFAKWFKIKGIYRLFPGSRQFRRYHNDSKENGTRVASLEVSSLSSTRPRAHDNNSTHGGQVYQGQHHRERSRSHYG